MQTVFAEKKAQIVRRHLADNGKLERRHGNLNRECIRPACPATLDEARRRMAAYVQHDNHVHLHGALGSGDQTVVRADAREVAGDGTP